MIQQSETEIRSIQPPNLLLDSMSCNDSLHTTEKQKHSKDAYAIDNEHSHSFDSISRLTDIDKSYDSANSSSNESPDTLHGTDCTDSPVSPLTDHNRYFLMEHQDPGSGPSSPNRKRVYEYQIDSQEETATENLDAGSQNSTAEEPQIKIVNTQNSKEGRTNERPSSGSTQLHPGSTLNLNLEQPKPITGHAAPQGRKRDPSHLHAQKTSIASLSSASRRAAATAAELNDGVLVGTRVSEGHENFVTAYNMLTGIRVAVSRCTAKINRPLSAEDFTATDEISFDLCGGGGSPSSKYMFRFKDYMPWVFRHLRDSFKLDPADYLMSLTSKYIVSELGSPGKSGSFFYYSRDYRFIIKTIHKGEHRLLRKILRQYYGHVQKNPDTLISQFYGLHRVRLPFGKKIHFVVMNNVFPALYEIHERFDLKGSLHGRMLKPDPSKPIAVYKDLDWLRRHRRIVLGPGKREKLIKQLEIDVQFLERVNVMDYSLLIGIHDMRKGNAALKSLLKLAEFGPQDEGASQTENRVATAAMHGKPMSRNVKLAQEDFRDLQSMLERATPERLKEFDFADEYRSEFYFYQDHGGFMSTDDADEDREVIYYLGIIDFLTGYGFRKSLETFFKGMVSDRKELSAVPAKEYGERFMKFMRGSIGPKISDSKADQDN